MLQVIVEEGRVLRTMHSSGLSKPRTCLQVTCLADEEFYMDVSDNVTLMYGNGSFFEGTVVEVFILSALIE